MRQTLLVTGGVILAVILVVGWFTYNQANQQQLTLSADLQSRTRVLADSLKESIEPSFATNATTTVQKIVDKIAKNEHLIGLSVFDSSGLPVAASDGLSDDVLHNPLVMTVMDSDNSSGAFVQNTGQNSYLFIEPLHNSEHVIGALAVVQSASYIDAAISNIWRDNLLRLFLQVLLIAIAIFVLVRWVFLRPLSKLAESLKAIRRGDVGVIEPIGGQSFLLPLSSEISKITTSLGQARFAASEEARLRLEKLDTPWTAERLKEFIKAYLKDRPIYVVTNREPYTHKKIKNEISYSVVASGSISAIQSVMEACGGTWLAHGGGNADRETANEEGKILVPPEDPKYTLKRIWLEEEEAKGHYQFSVEALYTLCHITHTRPVFRKEDWVNYRRVNGKFVETLLAEIKDVQQPIILVQDYHFALLPRMIKDARPDAQVALFWHVPWPNEESFSICPWHKEILDGMLGADVIGFNTQQSCNNFMDTVGKEIEALIDLERFAITKDGHTSHIKAFPISVAFTNGNKTSARTSRDRTILKSLEINTKYVGLGAERLDFIKGIPQRFKGIEAFFDLHPQFKKKFTFLQIAAPHRENLEKYKEYADIVTKEAERINAKFGTRDWKPIVLEKIQYTHAQLTELYKAADVCLVTSLHDSMNLVSKEYVAARDDEAGVLILSKYAGASRDLRHALIINPYSAEEIADAIHKALTMSRLEQRQRMRAMRNSVKDYNVYRWAAELIKAVALFS